MSNEKASKMEEESAGDLDGQGRDDLRISAIIPAYNAAGHLARAIASVLAQTRPAAEIVVVDDGSKDETFDLAASYGPPVRVVRQENAGASAARNCGIAESTGDAVAFLDADDEWLPCHLANAALAFRRHPDLQWYCDAYEEIGLDGKKQVVQADISEFEKEAMLLPDSLLLQSKKAFIFTSSVVIRRQALDKVGVFDTSLPTGEDLDLWFRLGLRFPQIGYSPDPGSRYCRRVGSLTTNGEGINIQRTVNAYRRRITMAEAAGKEGVSRAAPLIRKRVEEITWVLLRSGKKEDASFMLQHLGSLMRLRWRFVCCLYPAIPDAFWSLAARFKRTLH